MQGALEWLIQIVVYDGLSVFVCDELLWYFESTYVDILATSPYSCTCISLSTSDCMKSAGISRVVKQCFFLAPIIHNRNSDLKATVDALVYYFVLFTHCFLPSKHPRPFIILFPLFYKNMRYERYFCLSSLFVMLASLAPWPFDSLPAYFYFRGFSNRCVKYFETIFYVVLCQYDIFKYQYIGYYMYDELYPWVHMFGFIFHTFGTFHFQVLPVNPSP